MSQKSNFVYHIQKQKMRYLPWRRLA